MPKMIAILTRRNIKTTNLVMTFIFIAAFLYSFVYSYLSVLHYHRKILNEFSTETKNAFTNL